MVVGYYSPGLQLIGNRRYCADQLRDIPSKELKELIEDYIEKKVKKE